MKEQKQTNWIKRNWMWATPVGCFGLLMLIAGLGFGIFLFVMSILKSSDAYKEAFAAAKNNIEVQEALGTPIVSDTFVSGNINVNGRSGNAELSIPISGPLGKGVIQLEAKKRSGKWNFSFLKVFINNNERSIDLLGIEKNDE